MRPTLFAIDGVQSGRLSTMARPRGGDWLEEEMVALREAGVDVLVCMLTAPEMRELELTEEPIAAQDAGVRFLALPTPDRGVPELPSFRELIETLSEALRDGRHVVVHCRMGIGRSSMVAAALLMGTGRTANDAWSAIRQARGLVVPDTPEQREWVEAAVAVR
jgi:protein-tyrosine phosphatase